MRISPALLLFFLAPAIGELLSGSSPPAEFFNPLSLLLLSFIYGSGALLVRELKVRWNKSYVSLLLLGAAYGILEEGLMVKSFYDPAWMDLGVLGFYGRWIGVNWVWAEWLTIYHAVFSIAIPIILVESAFSDKRNRPWLSNRMLGGITALLCGVTVFGYLFLTPYRPPIPQYLFSILLVFALAFTAQRISNKAGKHGRMNPLSPLRMVFFGFIIALAFFMFFGAGPSIIGQPGLLMLLGFGLVITFYSLLRRYSWGNGSLYQKFSLAAGALSFLIFLTPIQEFDSTRADNPRGMLLIGTVAAIMLLLLRRKLKSSSSSLEANIYCMNCGRVLPANAIFCPDCGIEVETH